MRLAKKKSISHAFDLIDLAVREIDDAFCEGDFEDPAHRWLLRARQSAERSREYAEIALLVRASGPPNA